MRIKDWNINPWVIFSVIAIWSLGRVVNPLRHQALAASQTLGPMLGGLTFVYVTMQIGLLVYVVVLMIRLLRRYGLPMRSRTLGEFVLCAYIAATLILSLYFIAYELGYLPQSFEGFLLKTEQRM